MNEAKQVIEYLDGQINFLRALRDGELGDDLAKSFNPRRRTIEKRFMRQ